MSVHSFQCENFSIEVGYLVPVKSDCNDKVRSSGIDRVLPVLHFLERGFCNSIMICFGPAFFQFHDNIFFFILEINIEKTPLCKSSATHLKYYTIFTLIGSRVARKYMPIPSEEKNNTTLNADQMESHLFQTFRLTSFASVLLLSSCSF